jgi:hypothetical protein
MYYQLTPTSQAMLRWKLRELLHVRLFHFFVCLVPSLSDKRREVNAMWTNWNNPSFTQPLGMFRQLFRWSFVDVRNL